MRRAAQRMDRTRTTNSGRYEYIDIGGGSLIQRKQLQSEFGHSLTSLFIAVHLAST